MSAPSANEPDVFARIRESCAEVARRARWVRIDDGALDKFAALLARERPGPPGVDPAHQQLDDPEATLAFVVTINAVNFGSGWFPHLKKDEGRSGYLTVAGRLRRHFEKHGPLAAAELRKLDAASCAAIFGQELAPPIDELMELFAQALRDLGELLQSKYRGRFSVLVEQAGGRAAQLLEILTEMPLYRDVARYQELEVPLYKRAQITASDLALALGGRGLGRFTDLDRLTLFADNLVPHVLRMLGILVYDLDLAREVDQERLLESGSEPEVEIRAVALHAVERLAGTCAQRGWPVAAHQLDNLLWSRGQSPHFKSQPRHRTRCPYY